jgi:hypothetical protein
MTDAPKNDADALALDLLKEAFVKEWLRTGDPYKAGLHCYPADSGRAMRATWEWPNDPEVLAYRAELIQEATAEGTVAGMPSKFEMAREIYQLGQSTAETMEDRLAAFELSAKIMGYIERPSVNVDNRQINVDNRRVMVIKDHGNDAAWESAAARQQRGLLERSQTKPN